MTTTEAAEPEFPVRYVFMGRRINAADKAMYAYRHDGGRTTTEPGATVWYSKPLKAGAPIGAVIETTELADGRYYTGGTKAPRLVGSHTEGDELLEWETLDRATAQIITRAQVARRQLKDSGGELDRIIDNLRAVINKTRTTSERAALWSYIESAVLR